MVPRNRTMQIWADSIGSAAYDLAPRPYRKQKLIVENQNIEASTVEVDDIYRELSIEIPLPVYTKATSTGEELICQSRIMKVGERYPVIWEGKRLFVVKTDKDLEFYEVIEENGD